MKANNSQLKVKVALGRWRYIILYFNKRIALPNQSKILEQRRDRQILPAYFVLAVSEAWAVGIIAPQRQQQHKYR